MGGKIKCVSIAPYGARPFLPTINHSIVFLVRLGLANVRITEKKTDIVKRDRRKRTSRSTIRTTKVRCSEKTLTHADHHTTGERPPSTLIAVPVM